MRSTACIVIEGVLQKLVSEAPVPLGMGLYHSLATSFDVVLLADTRDRASVAHWLQMEAMDKHSTMIALDAVTDHLSAPQRRVTQVNHVRAQGHAVEVVIEPDPGVAARLLRAGYNVLSFQHAAYALPDWRPDYQGPERSWDQLSAQVAQAAYLRASDRRMDEHQ